VSEELLKVYEMVVEGQDTSGIFLVAMTVVADSLPSAQDLLDDHACANGWLLLTVADVEHLGSVGPRKKPGVRAQTGRAYLTE